MLVPTVDTEYSCKHDIKENLFLLYRLKLIVLFHESMPFYNLSQWLDSIPWFMHKKNLHSTGTYIHLQNQFIYESFFGTSLSPG